MVNSGLLSIYNFLVVPSTLFELIAGVSKHLLINLMGRSGGSDLGDIESQKFVHSF